MSDLLPITSFILTVPTASQTEPWGWLQEKLQAQQKLKLIPAASGTAATKNLYRPGA